MEDVLEFYAEPQGPARPVVCFDEASKEHRGNVTEPTPPAPGSPAKQDYEYNRHGTANLFVIDEPLPGRQHIAVMDRRTVPDFAARMKHLCDEMYPDATTIRVVQDNLNMHAIGSLFATYPQDMAECELSMLSRQCLDRRLSSKEAVAAEVTPWEVQRNRVGVRLVWSFRLADARRKLAHLYPEDPLR